MIGEIKNTLRTKMGKMYLYICLCGNIRRFEKEKELRRIEDENDILREEFERALEKVGDLVKNGELVLNKVNIGKYFIITFIHFINEYNCNIEKIRIYLAPKNFLSHVKEKVKPSDEEISRIKRNKRKFAGEQMRRELMVNGYDDTLDIDSRNEFARNKTHLNLISNEDSKLEDGLEKFLGINKAKLDNQNAYNSGRSYDEESVYTNNDIDVMRVRTRAMPKEEKKVMNLPQISIEHLAETYKDDAIETPPIYNKGKSLEFPSNPKSDQPKFERTVTQDALELGIFPKAATNNESKHPKSQRGKESSNENDETLTPLQLKGIFRKSITHKNNTINEESSDSDYDNEKHKKAKEEFFKQEKLFKRRNKIQKNRKMSNLNENENVTLTRVTRIQENKQKRIEKQQQEELVIEFDEELMNDSQNPDQSNENMINDENNISRLNKYKSKEIIIDDELDANKQNQYKDNDNMIEQVYIEEPGISEIDASMNEQLDF